MTHIDDRVPCVVLQVLDLGAIAAAGERCIDKIVVVEETEKDERIECHHRYVAKIRPVSLTRRA